MPSTTRPNAVYTPSSAGDVPVQMKNDVVALSGRVAAGHRHDAFDVPGVVELRREVVHQLLLLVAERRRTTREGTGLNDESRRDAMEGRAVVDAGGGKAHELPDGVRRLVGEELDRDRPGAGVEHRAIGAEFRRRLADERFGWRIANRDVLDLDPIGCPGLCRQTAASEIFWSTSSPSDTRANTVY